MSYYFLYQKKGIPTWLAYFFILVLTVSLSLFFRNKPGRIISRASKNLIAKNVTVSNITNESATIFFTTKDELKSYISYGSTQQSEAVLFDTREEKGQQARRLHYYVLRQLQPNTKYSFQLFLEGVKITETYSFKTLNKMYPQFSNAPAFGKILQSNFQGEADVLVQIKIPKYKTIYSSLSKSTGEWIVTLPFIMNDNQEEIELNESELLIINAIDSKLTQSTIKVRYKDTHPLRSVILGENYDFTPTNSVLGLTSKKPIGLITFPTEGSMINSFYPVFRGNARANTLVKIVLKPGQLDLLATVDSNGEWKYIPLNPLPPGKHELTVIAGNEKKSVSFNIGKSGESVLGEATPSASITPSQITTLPLQSPSPTPKTTPLLTLAPSAALNPTKIVTPTQVTQFISPTITKKEIPELGLNNNLIILFASGLSLLGLYLVLY